MKIGKEQMKITQGRYNRFHRTVEIRQRDEKHPGEVVIGDCNEIHESVRILVGPEGFRMGDYNVIHNHVFITGDVQMGHNNWVGQGSHLDGTGGLTIGNGVTVGFYCCIWSHTARGSILDGCTLERYAKTTIGNDAWLVGNGIHVAPGVTIGPRCTVLANAVVTKDCETAWTYGGVPASKKELPCWLLDLWPGAQARRFNALYAWMREFAGERLYTELIPHIGINFVFLTHPLSQTRLALVDHYGPCDADTSYFNYVDNTYTKRLTQLERDWMRFLRNKANFVPRAENG